MPERREFPLPIRLFMGSEIMLEFYHIDIVVSREFDRDDSYADRVLSFFMGRQRGMDSYTFSPIRYTRATYNPTPNSLQTET